MIRRVGLVFLGLLGVVFVAVVAAILFVAQIDFRSVAEKLASDRLSRPVKITELAIGWSDPLTIEMTGLHLANPAWGRTPDMVAIARLHAELALWPLLRGEIRLAKVSVERPVVVLERDPSGAGNWVFPGLGKKPAGAPAAPAPLPDLVIADMALKNGDLTFRTSSGKLLRVHVDQAGLTAADATSPIRLQAGGSYNDLPLTADMTLESFAALHRLPRPVATQITATSNGSVMRFNGTMTDPINFDGVKGAVDFDAGTSAEASVALERPRIFNAKLLLKGMLEKHGDQWRVTDLEGVLADTTIAGSVGLDEGPRGKPDHFDVDMDLGVLDVKWLTDRISTNTQVATPRKGIPLQVDENPGETFTVRLGVKQAAYDRYKLDAVAVEGSVMPGKIVLGKLAFDVADGRLTLSGTDETAGEGGHLQLGGTLSQASAGRLMAMAGADPSTLSGKLNAGVSLEMTGITTDDAMKSSRGRAVLSMSSGQMSREFLQMASIDVRLLFRKGQGSTPVSCFLGVISERNGAATVVPLRLRTSDGNVFGGGQVDLLRQTLDLHMQTESSTTHFFALDLPLHIEGTFANPKPGVTFRSGARQWDERAAEVLRLLPPELRQVAAGSRCAG